MEKTLKGITEEKMKPKRTFRDFMYDKNDIFIALIIIIASMTVIAWCVRNVMNYPNTLDSVTTAEEVQSAVEQESKTSNDMTQAKWKNDRLAKTITVEVADDSTEAAINSLIAYGLFDTADEFREECEKAGVSDADIKTGKFTFKKGWSRRKIVREVTA